MRDVTGSLHALPLWLLAVLLVFPDSVHAGAPIGDPFVISGAGEEEVRPAVAYNTLRQEYLIVWYNDRPGNDDIRAQRLTKIGAPIGSPFYISAGDGAERRYPDVTYNSIQDQYLVVWEHCDTASMSPGCGIYGRRVSGVGAVLDTSDIVIRSTGANLYTPVTPAVAYASTPDKYMVVWAETWHSTIIWDIYGQVVATSGALDGSQFSISTGVDAREHPDLAYDHAVNRYLVVWQQQESSLSNINAQQVHGGGLTYQSVITLANYANATTAPAVACLPTDPSGRKFLVVWELQFAPGDRNLFGRMVAEDGTFGPDFGIAYSGQDESSPAVAADVRANRYLVTWQSPHGIVDKPIWGRAVYAAAPFLGEVVEFPGVAAEAPAVASGPNGDFLVAWQDQPIFATNTNIYGQLWGNRAFLPMVLRGN